MVDFAKLKSMSGRKSLDKLSEQIDKVSGGKSQADDRFWSPTVDKAGNGYAVIRFLPAPENEDLPFIRLFSHGFQGPSGTWYIENSLTTLGKPDPVSEMNSSLWNSGNESDKDIARKQKRRLHYVSNIYVITDPGNPENDGKVFLFKYGKKIFDKLKEAMQPEFKDEQAVNPFDLWEGADFKLKIRHVEGYRNYDKSELVKPPSPLLGGDDDQLERVYKREHSLQSFLSAANFKTYDELKARMKVVLADHAGAVKKAEEMDLPESREKAPERSREAPARREPEARTEVSRSTRNAAPEEADDTLEFFQKLAR